MLVGRLYVTSRVQEGVRDVKAARVAGPVKGSVALFVPDIRITTDRHDVLDDVSV